MLEGTLKPALTQIVPHDWYGSRVHPGRRVQARTAPTGLGGDLSPGRQGG